MIAQHDQWQVVAQFLEEEIGYAIPQNKYYLMDNNLRKYLGTDCPNPNALVRKARSNTSLKQDIIESCTINESLFFRDRTLWSSLAERILPDLHEKIDFCNELHVLTCACSRGQEVYSLAMLLAETPLYKNIKVYITATDIDRQVLKYAKTGAYSDLEVKRGLDEERRRKWFQNSQGQWFINDELKRNITFKQINLNQRLNFARRFDLVFCRNVLIYFDTSRKQHILDQIAKYTNNHGYLILGGAESTLGLGNTWQSLQIGGYGYYKKHY